MSPGYHPLGLQRPKSAPWACMGVAASGQSRCLVLFKAAAEVRLGAPAWRHTAFRDRALLRLEGLSALRVVWTFTHLSNLQGLPAL